MFHHIIFINDNICVSDKTKCTIELIPVFDLEWREDLLELRLFNFLMSDSYLFLDCSFRPNCTFSFSINQKLHKTGTIKS